MNQVRGLVLLLCLAGCAGHGSQAGIGVAMSTGSALVPANVTGGTVTSLSYREQGGQVTRALLRIATALGNAPATRSVTTVSSGVEVHSGTAYVVTRSTTTTYITDTPEQLAVKAARANAMLKAIGNSEIPATFELDIATRSLGGDSSGWMSVWMYQGPPAVIGKGLFSMARLSAGLGAGQLTFYDREQTQLSENGTEIVATKQMADQTSYSYFGFPVRLDLALGSSGLFLRSQMDLNIMASIDSIYDDEDSPERVSPTHFGLGYIHGPVRFMGTVTMSRFRTNALSAGLELAIVL